MEFQTAIDPFRPFCPEIGCYLTTVEAFLRGDHQNLLVLNSIIKDEIPFGKAFGPVKDINRSSLMHIDVMSTIAFLAMFA
jgi:hypothetical protein